MALHRLTRITLGVPNVRQTADYYRDFGLRPVPGRPSEPIFATTDGGEQLRVVATGRRRLVDLGVGVDDPDDLDRVASSLASVDAPYKRTATSVTAFEPGTEVTVRVEIAPRLVQQTQPLPAYNGPGAPSRTQARAAGILRTGPVRPRKLGHVVLGSVNQPRSERFFVEGLGFKVSDRVRGQASFLRCSTDHHNVLVQQAPLAFLHHTSWELHDVDEVGRGATQMLLEDPARHMWGLGRHHVGSNFFWYLKDPAGNFSEYYADLDCIIDDALWTPGVWEGQDSLYSWGPPPPPSFLNPEDLAAMMTGAHSAK